MKKHAYLLAVDRRGDLVKLLLESLDDKRNDIFLHIDKKSDLKFNMFETKFAKLIEVEQMNVNWGGYSQIACSLRLLKTAKNHGNYLYYHFMQGGVYPLKSQDELHKFYDDNKGTEFISINNGFENRKLKIEFLNFFNELGTVLVDNMSLKKSGFKKWFLKKLNILGFVIQDFFNYDHTKKYDLEFRKGVAFWSITDNLAGYILSKSEMIKSIFKYSFCGDEFFVQTIAYNSDFKDKINWIKKNEISSSLYETTWFLEDKGISRIGHNFLLEDLKILLKSQDNFARKFEGRDGIYLINQIKKNILKRNGVENQNELISVIVPIYNSEKYLNRCLDSILCQTYKNLEILLIDDGSTDKSPEIIEKYAKKDSRIKIIYQKNLGPFGARETGIKNANGFAYQFVDSDDEMKSGMIEELLFIMQKYNADIVCCNYEEIKNGQNISKEKENYQVEIYEGNDIFEQLIIRNVVTVVQWNKLFKKDIFDDLMRLYPKGKYHSDEFIIHHELGKCKKYAFINKKLYKYYRHKSSITGSPNLCKFLDKLYALKERLNYFENKKYDKLFFYTYKFIYHIVYNFKTHPFSYPDSYKLLHEVLLFEKELIKNYSKYYHKISLFKRLKSRVLSVLIYILSKGKYKKNINIKN